MTLGGNWKAGLSDLIKAAADVGKKVTHAELRKALSAQALSLVQQQFRAGAGPDGVPWKPLEMRQGQPLRDRGLLARSWFRASQPEGFSVFTSVKYAHVHQTGMVIKAKPGKYLRFNGNKGKAVAFDIAYRRLKSGRIKSVKGSAIFNWIFRKSVRIPARPMLPTGELPAKWASEFQAVLDALWAQIGGG